MNYFCTLFDSYYLNRGLALHQSMLKNCGPFHLYIFAFDDISLAILKESNLANATVISLAEFENEELLRVKPTRTKGEYCWTCTPSTIAFCIEKFNLPHCTYIDADLYFYADPGELLSEMKDKSVLITEHRYTKEYDQSAESGIYCVQFVTFRNDAQGMKVLRWWLERCIEWCYNRFEDGKFGDQKYLDDWTTRFEGVHVLQHLGGGVAPWNIQQYDLQRREGSWFITDKKSRETYRLIFFHFHHLKFYDDETIHLSYIYDLKDRVLRVLYVDYIKELLEINTSLQQRFNFIAPQEKAKELNMFLRQVKKVYDVYRSTFGTYNVMKLRSVK